MFRRRAPAESSWEGPTNGRRAVVYRSRDRTGRLCAETIAEHLAGPPWRLDIVHAGPGGTRPLSARLLRQADLYVQPGGGTLERAYRQLRASRSDIRAYVSAGGRYLGLCLGGYLAGATPGFDLLPGDTDRYIDRPGAEVRHDGDAVIPVAWRGQQRLLFFQDGPHFVLDPADRSADVVARYGDGSIAALVAPFGRGRVAVCGPHPEATADWFDDLPPGTPTPDGADLVQDLLRALLVDDTPTGRPGADHRIGVRDGRR